ncbi:purine-nucleoside phosphorylase [Clostridium sp. AM58-1XD]|uniref:purine-nucleoside phosphorylase n=1 Tax=Clostridium sp. AM58-1XD TaxID=2292307 RepID=UPI000E4BFB1C|nr:purine-nucleoside phosphorylase [Clostridium sp. AM58-1XD]RGY96181.1 purine-nucleoside phosphorylase [Clostridium sp. AM58-1XD]
MGLTAPTHHIGAAPGEFAKTVLMPGDPLRAKYIAETYLDDVKQINEIRCMYAYTGTYKGKPVSVMAHGIGSPSMAVHAYELYHLYDVENIIRVGTTGGLAPDLKLKDIIIAMGACYDTPYINQFHLSGTFSAIPSYQLLKKAVESAEKLGVPYRVGNVLSTDVFYPADDCQLKWKDMGILSVEMEIAALYIVAAAAGKNALGILTVSDHIVRGDKTTAQERQNSFTNMMEIALEMV